MPDAFTITYRAEVTRWRLVIRLPAVYLYRFFTQLGGLLILTFGLLSPNKGIEIMLDAMPSIIKTCRNAVYVILGATHPNLVRDQGEAYRDYLTARVRELRIGGHVVFVNQFVDQATLLNFISMCDVYVTPYLNEAQMTSGTLAYSFGLGRAVVSTPYWQRDTSYRRCGSGISSRSAIVRA